MNSEPDTDRLPPAVTRPPARVVLRGRGAILIVTAYFAVAAAFFTFILMNTPIHRIGEWPYLLWVLGEVIRCAGLVWITILLWRYATAVKRYNVAGESVAARLESAHAALWRWGAAFVVFNSLCMAIVLSRPTVHLPVENGAPAVQVKGDEKTHSGE